MDLNQRLQRIAENRLFEWTAVSVIIASALLLGAKTFELKPATRTALGIIDWGITVFFVLEISLRFIATPDKKKFFSNGWNVFDTIIVAVSLIPGGGTDQVLVARLIRVFPTRLCTSFDVHHLLHLCSNRHYIVWIHQPDTLGWYCRVPVNAVPGNDVWRLDRRHVWNAGSLPAKLDLLPELYFLHSICVSEYGYRYRCKRTRPGTGKSQSSSGSCSGRWSRHW